MAERCACCRYWRADTASGDFDGMSNSFGHCRRYPPKVSDHMASLAIGTPRSREIVSRVDLDKWATTDVVYDSCLLPVTFCTDWCGEFDDGGPVVPA